MASLSKKDRIDGILENARQRKVSMATAAGVGGGEEYTSANYDGAGAEVVTSKPTYGIGAGGVETESSADEETSIVRREQGGRIGGGMDYSSIQTHGQLGQQRPHGQQRVSSKTSLNRPSTASIRRRGRVLDGNGNGNNNGGLNGDLGDDGEDEHEGWWARFLSNYGSIELENKGSVARDHLALERTFLAWLRTSLAFASIGIAITQLFRLNTTSAASSAPNDPYQTLRQMGKPLGATFLGISIVMLFVGFHRYFESQHWIIRGKFPASRGSITLVALITFALMITSLVVVIVAEPKSYEKR